MVIRHAGSGRRNGAFGVILFGLASMLMQATSAHAQSPTADCLLEVGSTRYIDGPCEMKAFLTNGPMGSFQLAEYSGSRIEHATQVVVVGIGQAQATWSGSASFGRSPIQLGRVSPTGACWDNADARICAWKLGEPRPPQLARRQAPPDQFRQPAFPRASTALAASGPEFDALMGKLIPGRCHMNSCGWSSIETRKLVGSTPKGELYELGMKSWSATYPDGNYNRPARRVGDGTVKISYVFCSKQAPIWIDNYEGRWLASRLQPGNSKAVFGANEAKYALYWGACHRAIVRDVLSGGDHLGKKLGYYFAGEAGEDALEDVTLKSPFEVLNGDWPNVAPSVATSAPAAPVTAPKPAPEQLASPSTPAASSEDEALLDARAQKEIIATAGNDKAIQEPALELLASAVKLTQMLYFGVRCNAIEEREVISLSKIILRLR